MPDPIFRPGDRVRCVEPGPTSLIRWHVYTVVYAMENGVRLREHPNSWYDGTRFRKVEEVENVS